MIVYPSSGSLAAMVTSHGTRTSKFERARPTTDIAQLHWSLRSFEKIYTHQQELGGELDMNEHTQQQNLLQQKKKSTSDLLSKTFTQNPDDRCWALSEVKPTVNSPS